MAQLRQLVRRQLARISTTRRTGAVVDRIAEKISQKWF